MTSSALPWQGRIVSVQPRIRMTRSFDERAHSYLGYVLVIDGQIGEEGREFSVAVGKAAHEKHGFRVGMVVSGKCQPVLDPRQETAQYYKASGLKVERAPDRTEEAASAPPFHGVAPSLPVYRERGHRRLDVKTYRSKCTTCIWGCKMPVEIIVDHWNPSRKKYREETFCYGPKSCHLYRAGPARKVPGRRGMSWEEEDWVDEDATAHRGEDE